MIELGRIAHARRKFYELHANHKSEVAGQALAYIGMLYDVEPEVATLSPEGRRCVRQEKARTVADAL